MNQTSANTAELPANAEMSLRFLAFYVLKRWRFILLFVLACAVGALIISTLQLVLLPEDDADGVMAEYIYNQKAAEYDQNIEAVEDEITALETALAEQQDYINNSYLMQLNPTRKIIARLTYYINYSDSLQADDIYGDTDYIGSLLKRYALYINAGDLYAELMEQFPAIKSVEYLQEILAYSKDTATGTLAIAIVGDDEQTVQAMLDIVRDGMAAVYAETLESIGDHKLVELDSSFYTINDEDLAKKQQENADQIDTLKSQIEDKTVELFLLGQDMDNLTVDPAAFGISAMDMITPVLYAAIGGWIMILLLLAMRYIVADKVYDVDKLRCGAGFGVLAEIPRAQQKRKRLLDKLAMLVGGVRLKSTQRDSLLLLTARSIHATVTAQGISEGTIAVAGSIDAEELQEITEQFNHAVETQNLQFVAAGNPLQDALSVDIIGEAAATVAVEKQDVSMCADICKEIARMTAWGKTPLGIVLLDVDAV